MSTARPRVLAVVPGLFPSTIIGVAKPLLRLHLAGQITLDLKLPPLVSRRSVERADVAVFCRELPPRSADVLGWIKQRGTPLIHELDDNLLDIPDDIPGLEYARDAALRALLIDCLTYARVVRVYSPALRDRLTSITDRVQLVAGPLDWSLIPDAPPTRDLARVRIVYATSRVQDRVSEAILAPVRKTLDRFPHVELTIWGPRIDRLMDHPRVRWLRVVADYDEYIRRFVAEGFDIGLAPLRDDVFQRCKSNLKFREFAAARVAGIYSNTPVYAPWVSHGRTGLLVGDGEEDWLLALERLIGDGDLRRSIADRAQDFARQHFNEATTSGEWMAAISPLAAAPRQPLEWTAPNGRASRAHLGELAQKVVQTFKREGLVAAGDRLAAPLRTLTQMAAWQVRRWRLEHRVGLPKGRA